MNFSATTVLCVSSALLLAGCGGSDGPTTVDPDPVFAASVDNFLASTSANGWDDLNTAITTGVTPLANIPSSNTTYTGQIAVIVSDEANASAIDMSEASILAEGMMGDMQLDFNVSPTDGVTLSGLADNFQNVDGSAVGGQITFGTAPAVLNTSTGSLTFLSADGLSGSLTNTPIGNANLTSGYAGGFVGDDADIWGFSNASSATSASGTFASTFILSND